MTKDRATDVIDGVNVIRVQLPAAVVAEVTTMAEADRVSFDQILIDALAGHLSARKQLDYLRERGRRGSRERFLAALDNAPDVPPVPGDELD